MLDLTLQARITEELPKFQGWCSLMKALALAQVIVEKQAEVAIEIGVFGGASLVPVALAMQHQKFGVIHGIDPWCKNTVLQGLQNTSDQEWWDKVDMEGMHKETEAHINRLHLEDHVELWRENSFEAVSRFADNSITLLTIDGGHSEAVCVADAALYYPKLMPGGFVFLDDICWLEKGRSTTLAALRFFIEHGCKLVQLIDECLVLQKF